MNKSTVETKQYALQLLERKVPLSEIENETGVPVGTLKAWRHRYLTIPTELKIQVNTIAKEAISEQIKLQEKESNTDASEPKTEIDTNFNYSNWQSYLLPVAVIILCSASITAVGEILSQAFPLAAVAYAVATVACLAPLLLLFSGVVAEWLAWAIISCTFVIEVTANSIAVSNFMTPEFITTETRATNLQHITFSWCVGMILPFLALCFEIILFKKITNN